MSSRGREPSRTDGLWEPYLAAQLDRRASDGRLRSLDRGEGHRTGGPDSLLNLSANDYLGLSTHPQVIAATINAAQLGAGSTSARLLVGDDHRYCQLEEKLAYFQGTEAALIFGSGYLANVGVLAALVGRHDAVFSDHLNHASIVDGCRLSQAALYRYRHCDLAQLEVQLQRADRGGAKRKLIVTESVFSMDGDVAPLAGIVELKERYGAAMFVDEAHAEGMFGPQGQGYAHALGIADRIELHLGTFGKAFGAYGAYVTGNALWIRYLVNTARTFIFATALPPSVIGAVDAALEIMPTLGGARRSLAEKAERFRTGLRAWGIDVASSSTQIVPVMVGDSRQALELSRHLLQSGVLTAAIRPPTVPVGTARLRCSLSAVHQDDDLARAVDLIGQAAVGLGLGRHG